MVLPEELLLPPNTHGDEGSAATSKDFATVEAVHG